MRCKNCGWENEDGSMKCAKCNAPLKGSMVESARPSYESSADSRVLKGTISERKFFSRETETEEAVMQSREEVATVKNCPECGYQVSPNMKVCPACGYQFSPVAVAQQPIEPIKKTCPSCVAKNFKSSNSLKVNSTTFPLIFASYFSKSNTSEPPSPHIAE